MMRAVARRLALWRLPCFARRALLVMALMASGSMAQGSDQWRSEALLDAEYGAPTERYPHGVLGDEIEYGALHLRYTAGITREIQLPMHRVFEDVAPRLVDVDRDGRFEVLVVESDQDHGARLAVYDGAGLRVATPFIGARFRWRAPFAVADLDGDGFIEIAEIDRPHLAKTLRIWRFRDARLEPVAQYQGVTNHRIGERDIAGGLRDCGNGPEMITASANWSRVIASRLVDGDIATQDLGRHVDRRSLLRALECKAL